MNFRHTLLVCFVIAIVATPCIGQDFRKFTIDWESHRDTVIDLSGYLDAPAGHAGFIRAEGEQFVDGNRNRKPSNGLGPFVSRVAGVTVV